MAQRLKRWESPRREGRNDKGRGGSARQRQRRKQIQLLRQKLKEQSDHQNKKGGGTSASPFFVSSSFVTMSCRTSQLLPKIGQHLC